MSEKKNIENEMKNIDLQLGSLVEECLQNGLSETQVYRLIEEHVCKKASQKMTKISRSRNFFITLKVLVITLIFFYIMTRKPFTTDILKMVGRQILINIRPIYDWTVYYETNCLIKNQEYIFENNPQCNLCENMEVCELINNSDDLNNLTNLMNNQRAIKISGNVHHMLMENRIFSLTFNQLGNFYLELNKPDQVCMFESNLNFENILDLMSQLNDQYLPLYAQWENCGYFLRKKLRMLYEIPEFMPMMLEFTRENWFLISINNFKSKNFKKIDIAIGTRLAVLMQIVGSNRIQLIPKEECLNFGCIKLEEKISEQELCEYCY